MVYDLTKCREAIRVAEIDSSIEGRTILPKLIPEATAVIGKEIIADDYHLT